MMNAERGSDELKGSCLYFITAAFRIHRFFIFLL
jgi:hypothetical protein